MKPDKRTSKERIEHVLSAIAQIQSFSKGHHLESFAQDRKTYSACLYEFTIIGEATTKMDRTILDKYDYPWDKVKSFRNFILHEYEAVDLRVVWDTIIKILPEMKKIMNTILKNEF